MNSGVTVKAGGRYVRLGSLLLMLIFTLCSFALMWTGVDCLRRIGSAYENASDGMAAAQFAANNIRSADGDIYIYTNSDGVTEKIVISMGGDYLKIISFDGENICEALVHEGVDYAAGDPLFSADGFYAAASDAANGLVKVSVILKGAGDEENRFTEYARTSGEIHELAGKGILNEKIYF